MFNLNELNFDDFEDMETEFVDLDGDGIEDSIAIDFDGDGVIDAFSMDMNGDGIMDSVLIDGDGDGYMETFAMDSNGDNIMDTYFAELDSDNDGYIDTFVTANDYNQDGVIESQTIYRDNNGDGVYDQVMQGYDSDGDGELDTFTTHLDLDFDGKEDAIIEEQLIDEDGDGLPDTYIVKVDADGDSIFEEGEIQHIDYETGTVEVEPLENIHAGTIAGTYVDELENFDPEKADMDSVSGDPVSSMEEWEYQGDTGRCALYSQKFVIQELTGEDVDIEEIVDLAEENGWFSEENGTPLLNMDKVLEHFGIDSEMSFHNDISDIEECLESGGKVIVAIDADEIWYGENDNVFNPGEAPNHAVQVIGIDRTNPDEPMVILNDSGTPNGCGEMVPLDDFVDAWEDGNCQMITCM